MQGFKGDTKLTAGYEIKKYTNGRPYHNGSSHRGVSLLIGVDLSIFKYNQVIAAYGEVLNHPQANSILMCRNMKGDLAQKFLQLDIHLKTISIPFDLAIEVFPIFADRTWKRISKKWPEIINSPPEVQTAVFDVAYSRGVHNTHINCMTEFIKSGEWNGLSKCIRNMQQRSGEDELKNRRIQIAKLIS